MEGRGEIAVVAHSEGEFDVIALRDDGPGVDPEAKELVFEPLYTTKAKGTGLGLPICRQIVERHGGSIELAEPRAPGARMVVHLPRSKARMKEQEAG
jgi:signal transduction histidine kinase